MKKILIAFVALAALSGCASDMSQYYKAVEAQSADDKAWRLEKMKTIQALSTGSETAKIMGMVMLNLPSGEDNRRPQIAAPRSAGETTLEWFKAVADRAIPIFGIVEGNRTARNSSDNSVRQAESSNNMMTSVVGSGFKANTDIAGQIKQPAPNISIGGNGVIGNGSFKSETVGGDGATGGSTYTSDSYNPQTDNSNHDNPVTNPPAPTAP